MSTEPDWRALWDRAKALEQQVVERKRAAQASIARLFPKSGKKRFGDLVRALASGKLTGKLAEFVAQSQQQIEALASEAATCRRESDRLLAEMRKADTRPWLDPRTDPIPHGEYPKLRQCATYPLRQDCNYGENATARWKRCEFMKYDDSKAISDRARWRCTAVE